MISKAIDIISRSLALGSDFSEEGFTLRAAPPEPTKSFLLPKMWVGNMGWSAGTEANIVRCYPDGFSFWRGSLDDRKEWFCEYAAIVGYKKPLGIKLADSIIIIGVGDSTVDCMLGEAASYIQDIAPRP